MTIPSFFQTTVPAPQPLPLFINPPRLYDPRPHGYSHVAVAKAPARFIYVAGQGGEDASGVLPLDFGAQVEQALHNLQIALEAAGAGLLDVVRLVVLVVDHSEARLALLGRALAAAWGDEPPPACTLIPVPRLALDGMLFEIEATAVTALARSS
jgi:enamine deaminase RidA (YjgF/YER057c/UK114 family)